MYMYMYNEQFVISMPLTVLLACRSDVLVLQFSHERRDRRRREYVMIEENQDSIMGILTPISEDNQKAFSLASKVEVGCTLCIYMYKYILRS